MIVDTGFQIKLVIIIAQMLICKDRSINAGKPDGLSTAEGFGIAVVAITGTKRIIPEIFHQDETIINNGENNILRHGILGEVKILLAYCDFVFFCQRGQSMLINIGVENIVGAEIQHSFDTLATSAVEAGNSQCISARECALEWQSKLVDIFKFGCGTGSTLTL